MTKLKNKMERIKADNKFATKASVLKLFFVTTVVTGVFIGSQIAKAQSVDQGDFVYGDIGAPNNRDSEYVPGLGMEYPTYAGTGCPQGTLTPILSPDQRTLSILFDAYIAEAGGHTGQRRNQMSCQIYIRFQVPPGYQVDIVKMDYRGFTSIPHGARSTFGAGFHYLHSDRKPTETPRVLRAQVFLGPKEESFILTSELRARRSSPCGKPFVLVAESMMNVQTNNQNDDVITTIDSLDAVSTPVQYSLRWSRCNDRVSPRPGRPTPPAPPRPPVRPGRPGRY